MELKDIETVMKLMKEHRVTALKIKDLEIAMPLEHIQESADEDAEMSDEDLLFYSSLQT